MPLLQLSGLPYLLLSLAAALLFLSFARGRYDEGQIHRTHAPVRMISSLLLVLCAILWRLNSTQEEIQILTTCLAAGMTFSFLGDLAMAELLPVSNHVLAGIGCFSLAHVAYVAGYGVLAGSLGLFDLPLMATIALAFILLGGVLWAGLVRGPAVPAALNLGALGYAFLLSAMAGLAVSLAIQEPRLWTLALGAVLFMASDIILANRLFRQTAFPLIGDLVWALYWTGQALIVFTPAVLRSILQ